MRLRKNNPSHKANSDKDPNKKKASKLEEDFRENRLTGMKYMIDHIIIFKPNWRELMTVKVMVTPIRK